MSTVLITGNTFPVKEEIKALGGRWDPAAKGWRVPADKAAEAQALVGAVPVVRHQATPLVSQGSMRMSGPRQPRRSFTPCGYPGCNSSYCDECDGRGR